MNITCYVETEGFCYYDKLCPGQIELFTGETLCDNWCEHNIDNYEYLKDES